MRDSTARAPVVVSSTHAKMEPLRDSPLRILDAGGALVLVLERVSKDDALCVALVCTSFRDAILAQPRHAVRPDNKRFLMSVMGVACSAQRLAWVRGLGSQMPVWVAGWNKRTCGIMSRIGALEALQWARANGCDWDVATCANAAAGGHLKILQWARSNGCDWDAATCSGAAAGGHLEILQWARSNGCDWDADTCAKAAAAGGHLEILQWARSNGCPL